MRAISIGIPFIRRRSGVPIDAQAQAHFNRVIADGGVVPSGLSGVNAFFSAVKAIYGTSDINTAISAAYDPHYLGYRLGAGSGATLGQAAQTLYSVKSTENLFLQSEDFASGNWNKIAISITSNSINAPNGTLTADTILVGVDASATRHRLQQTPPLTLTNGVAYTASFYLKKGQHDWIQICGVTGFPNDVWANFNLDTGTIGNIGGAGTTATIVSLSDGWYRCSVSGVANLTGLGGLEIVTTNNTNSGRYPSYQSLVAENVCYVWGAQLNTGSVALPYTPTTTTAETLADVTQTTAASQPLLLAHTGENYWFGSGVANNFVSTPNAAANQITGDIVLTANVRPVGAWGASIFGIFNKRNAATQIGYAITVVTGGFIRFGYSTNGTTLIELDSTAAVPFTANQRGWIRVFRNATTGVVQFFTSTDGTNWTQLGSNVAGASGAMWNSTANVNIGQSGSGASASWSGEIYRAYAQTSIGGTILVDFNPSSYNPANSQTSWVSTTGETWTLNVGTATTGYKGVLVNRSIVQGDGIDDGLVSGTISAVFTFSRFIAYNPFNKDLTVYVVDGNIQDRHSLYQSTTARFYNSGTGAGEVTTTLTSYRLQMLQGDYNGASSKASTNNGTENTGTVGNNSRTAVKIFGTISGVTPLNGIVNTLIDCSLVSGAQRTAMYNAIRGFNNNAF